MSFELRQIQSPTSPQIPPQTPKTIQDLKLFPNKYFLITCHEVMLSGSFFRRSLIVDNDIVNFIKGLDIEDKLKDFFIFFLYKDKNCREDLNNTRNIIISIVDNDTIITLNTPTHFFTGSYAFKKKDLMILIKNTPFISGNVLDTLDKNDKRKEHRLLFFNEFHLLIVVLNYAPIKELKKLQIFKNLQILFYSEYLLGYKTRLEQQQDKYTKEKKNEEKVKEYDIMNDFFILYNIICKDYYSQFTYVNRTSYTQQTYFLFSGYNYNLNYDETFNNLVKKLRSNLQPTVQVQPTLKLQPTEQPQMVQGGKKNKSLSDCTVKELRSKMKKRKIPYSKDGKKLTKSQMIQKLRR